MGSVENHRGTERPLSRFRETERRVSWGWVRPGRGVGRRRFEERRKEHSPLPGTSHFRATKRLLFGFLVETEPSSLNCYDSYLLREKSRRTISSPWKDPSPSREWRQGRPQWPVRVGPWSRGDWRTESRVSDQSFRAGRGSWWKGPRCWPRLV